MLLQVPCRACGLLWMSNNTGEFEVGAAYVAVLQESCVSSIDGRDNGDVEGDSMRN